MFWRVTKSFLVTMGIIVVVLYWAIARPTLIPGTKKSLILKARPHILESHVRKLSEDFVPRNFQNPLNLALTADYIRENLRSFARAVKFQEYNIKEDIYKNVIATFGPISDEVIVIGAHYDAYDIHPAADDNASGVAGLLELGWLLKNTQLKHKVELVAFTLEEPPYFGTKNMGSAVYVRSLKKSGRKVRLMISLEMLGYYNDERETQGYPSPLLKLFYPSRGNFIAIIDQFVSSEGPKLKHWMASQIELEVYSINAPSWVPGVDFSDHRNFWSQDFPAVMVTDTAFFRNKEYHTPKDTAERLDYDRMADVVSSIASYIEGY